MCSGRGKPLKEEWDRKNPNEPFPISETVKQQEAASVSDMTSNNNSPTKKKSKSKKVTASTSSQNNPNLSIPGTTRTQSNLNIPN